MKKLLRALGLSLGIVVPVLAGPTSPPAGNFIINTSTNAAVQVLRVSSGTFTTQISTPKIKFADGTSQTTAGGGGSSTTTVTATAIPFGSSSNTIATDTATLTFDNTNKILKAQIGNFSSTNMNLQLIPGAGTGTTGAMWMKDNSGFGAQFEMDYSILNDGTTSFDLLWSKASGAGNVVGWNFQNSSKVTQASISSGGNINTLGQFNSPVFNITLSSVSVTGVGGFTIVSSSAGQNSLLAASSATVTGEVSGSLMTYADSGDNRMHVNYGASASTFTYATTNTTSTRTTGDAVAWCGTAELCDAGAAPSTATVNAASQYAAAVYPSPGSSSTISGATNVSITPTTFTITNAYTISLTQVSSITLSGVVFDVRGSTFIADVITTTSGILGITTASSANPGIVGEYLSSTTIAASPFPTTGNFGDLVSMTLTAGDWDVSAVLGSQANSATVTTMSVGISSTTGNSSAGLREGDSLVKALGPTAATDTNAMIPVYRVNVSASTIYYLKYSGGFSIATPNAVGRLSARRIR